MDRGTDKVGKAEMTSGSQAPWSLPGTLAQKGLLIVGLPTVLQLAFLGMIMHQNSELQYAAENERHYRQLFTCVGGMAIDSFQVCGHLNNLMTKPDKESLAAVAVNIRNLRQQTKLVKEAAKWDPNTRQICNEFEKTSKDLQHIFVNSTRILMGGLNRDSALELYEFRQQFKEAVPRFLEQHQKLVNQSFELSNTVTDLQNRQRTIQRNWIFGAAITSAALCILIGMLFSREIRSRLAVIKSNTQLLGTGAKLLPAVGGQDEIKELDTKFREMAVALDEAKEKERALVTESQDMICSLDDEGRFSLFNPATCAVLGAEASDLKGKELGDFIAASSLSSLRQALEAARSAPAMVELVTNNETAGARFLSVAINWSEQQQSYFLAAHDITRRKELEQMQRDLYAMIAHDVRSPLMSAKMSIELTRMGVADEKDRLEKAERSIDRVTGLINDLLDMEKLQSGKFEICADKCASSDIIGAAIDSVSGMIENKNLVLTRDVQDLSLYADRELLTRVVFNLLSNAIKFSPSGSELLVSCKQQNDEVRFSIKDSGVGISEEDQKRLFQRFVQVGGRNSTPVKGTGLGLAICKMIVEEHDGKIGVSSTLDKGSEFWFSIPLVSSGDEIIESANSGELVKLP